MNGRDPRRRTACPPPAAPPSPHTPVTVVELDLADPGQVRSPAGRGPADPDGRVSALVRLHGHPLGMVDATGTAGRPAALAQALVAAAHRRFALPETDFDGTAGGGTPDGAESRPSGTANGGAASSGETSNGAPLNGEASNGAASSGEASSGEAPNGAAPNGEQTTATPGAGRMRAGRPRVPAGISVVICTRDRAELLPECLDSVLRAADRADVPVDVLLVDNAPTDPRAEQLVAQRYPGRVRYLCEPEPGLSRARNRGLAAARREICAFTDDDALADPRWLAELAAAFAADPRTGCVTGLVVPAELDTPAQQLFERYAGTERGWSAHDWNLDAPDAGPLDRYSTGRCGIGANMAFRTELLRALGGFDPATGAGTPSRGGEDLLAFHLVLTAGRTVAYRPDAVVWHRHRRTLPALVVQVRGLGIGFGAYLAAAVRRRPALLGDLLLRLPAGALGWHRGHRPPAADTPLDRRRLHALRRMERRGLLQGPPQYLRTVRRQRHAPSGG